jgi:site-specific DNA-methyltransferase (adenine-specific)
MLNKIHSENCLATMKRMPDGFVDLVVTSPPYDNLRTYNGYSFDFDFVVKELFRVMKHGGVVVWVVGDATLNGSETGTSFRQALGFMDAGFRLHDTMIWEKTGRLPTQDRYYAIFEYMFVFSKGKPKSMNFICDHVNKNSGQVRAKDNTINRGKRLAGTGTFVTKALSRRPNIWKVHNAGNKSGHPAVFPEQLAADHISTWSGVNDVVYDPFMGSGTTAMASLKLKRNFIGSEISKEYVEIAEKRLQEIGQIE